jgi:Rab-like protein 3
LIRRRYFSDEIPAPAWSIPSSQSSSQRIDESFIEDDQSYNTRYFLLLFKKSFSCFVPLLTNFIVNCSRTSDPYKYNMLPPLPAQRNLTPPPTLYPQQPVSVSESYSFPRFSLSGSSEMSASSRTKRSDINVWRSICLLIGHCYCTDMYSFTWSKVMFVLILCSNCNLSTDSFIF